MPTIKQHPDDTLIAMLTRGDARAVTYLYAHYYKYLFGVAKAQLHSADEADEVVQKLFITIWQKSVRLNLKRPLLRYLLKSVQNRIRNIRRDNHHQRIRLLSMEEVYGYERALLAEAADSGIFVDEIQNCVVNAKQKMKPHVQKIFELRVEQGKSQAEIAIELGISVKAVEKSLASARKTARAFIGKRGW